MCQNQRGLVQCYTAATATAVHCTAPLVSGLHPFQASARLSAWRLGLAMHKHSRLEASVARMGGVTWPLDSSLDMAYVFISAFSKVISTVVAPDKVSIDNWCFKLFYRWTVHKSSSLKCLLKTFLMKTLRGSHLMSVLCRLTPMILGVSTVLVCARWHLYSFNISNKCHLSSSRTH